MADALTQAYDAAAAAGGPGAAAALQLGKELGAKPPGTVTVRYGHPSDGSWERHRRLGLDLLGALLAAGITRDVEVINPATNEKVPYTLRPDLSTWLAPRTLLVLGGWIKSRKPVPSPVEWLSAAQFLAGDRVTADGNRNAQRPEEGALPPTTGLLELFLYAAKMPLPQFNGVQGGLLGDLGAEPTAAKDALDQQQRSRNWRNAGILATVVLVLADWWRKR